MIEPKDIRQMTTSELEALFDEVFAEALADQAAGRAAQADQIFDEVMASLDETGRAKLLEAIDGLGRIFGQVIPEPPEQPSSPGK